MTDTPKRRDEVVSLDHIVIPAPKRAGEFLVEALSSGNPQLVANAVGLKPNEVFTLNLNIALNFSYEDIQTGMALAGLDVKRPGQL